VRDDSWLFRVTAQWALLCSVGAGRARPEPQSVSRSDRSGELGERGRDAPMGARINPEFVVAAPNVLHESVTRHDHTGALIAFESTCKRSSKTTAPVTGL
jgi:hypothetical protein